MDHVKRLIEHLLGTSFSIDSVETIIASLHCTKEQLRQIVESDRYSEFFQWLKPHKNRSSASDKIALTLDLFCCTHYAQQCRNLSCSFLHLCPYNVRPMHTKCTNKNCPYDHDIDRSAHNQKILETRQLLFLPRPILHEVTRASADPKRSFWVCPDYGKKGCPKKTHCDKLHYCYFDLTDACTKHNCPHLIDEACLAYFRLKQIADQDYDDILNAFRKVLRQRKSDYVATLSNTQGPVANDKRKNKSGQPSRATPTTAAAGTTDLSNYDDIFPCKSDPTTPVPEHEQDIFLSDSSDRNETIQVEHYLTNEVGCPVKLLVAKTISSAKNELQNLNENSKPVCYYCPTKSHEIFRLLRWQNHSKQFHSPLTVYLNARDAHDASEQNTQTNQFCLLRLQIHSTLSDSASSLPPCLELNDPKLMFFDRMWIYVFNF